MKNKFTLISINIAAVFIITMAGTFIPESFPELFGDLICGGGHYEKNGFIGCTHGGSWNHNPELHWGARHWLWFFMAISLFIVQVVRIITIINKEEQ